MPRTARPLCSAGADGRAARVWTPIVAWLALAAVAALASCTATTHVPRPAKLGRPASVAALTDAIARPGPIRFTRVVAADWVVARSGLVNLDHPTARAAGLVDGDEPIEIFLYVLEHPSAGDFLVDSGVAADFLDGASDATSALVESVMGTERLEIHVSTAEWLAGRERPISGVFLTHVHLDHVMGLPDVPIDVPAYVGPGETRARAFLNLFTQGSIDRTIGRARRIEEWGFVVDGAAAGSPEAFAPAVLDVFGDGSLWAIHVPGHTPGSTAFLVRSTEGPKLLVGDTSHTRWGWENGVEPGSFTADHAANAASLAWLKRLARAHPAIEVHLGHQRLEPAR